VQDQSFDLTTDNSGFLNFASSGLDGQSDAGSSFSRPPPPNGTLDDPAAAFDRPVPPSSTSMDDHGLLSKPPSRPTSAELGDGDGARSLSPMSSDVGPDTKSTELGLEKTKNDDFFKKPVENMSLEEVGTPAAASAGPAAAARYDPLSWATLLWNYSQETTMHGLPYITRGARFVARRSPEYFPTADYFVWGALYVMIVGIRSSVNEVSSRELNPLECKGTYSVTSNNMKLHTGR